jgi:hypothetical protein
MTAAIPLIDDRHASAEVRAVYDDISEDARYRLHQQFLAGARQRPGDVEAHLGRG